MHRWEDSVRINLLFYLFFTVVPSNVVCFFPVDETTVENKGKLN